MNFAIIFFAFFYASSLECFFSSLVNFLITFTSLLFVSFLTVLSLSIFFCSLSLVIHIYIRLIAFSKDFFSSSLFSSSYFFFFTIFSVSTILPFFSFFQASFFLTHTSLSFFIHSKIFLSLIL